MKAKLLAALSFIGILMLENDADLVKSNVASWIKPLGFSEHLLNDAATNIILRVIVYGLLLLSVLLIFFKNKEKDSPPTAIDNSVRSVNQTGGITARYVNIGNHQRTLNTETKTDLLNSLGKEKPVDIVVAMNDQEADTFAHEIRKFLADNGYKFLYETMLYEAMSGGRGIPYISLGDDTNEVILGPNVNISDQISFLGHASRPAR